MKTELIMSEYTKYFKSKKGFSRFMKKLYEKYKSLSKFSGTIKLNNITEEEAKDLTRFFGVEYYEGTNITIKIKDFEHIMARSKYEDFDINKLIEEYYNVALITNKENKQIMKDEEDLFYQEIYKTCSPILKSWLEKTRNEKKNGYKILKTRYNLNKTKLTKELLVLSRMLDNLPSKKTSLTLFASLYSNDPHYLDFSSDKSNLFINILSDLAKVKLPFSNREKIELLSKFNLEIDLFSNNTFTYNLITDREEINEFQNEALILNIQNILKTNTFSGIDGNVFILENPSLLSEIIKEKINKTIIISNGFINLSTYLILDKLLESNNKLYYNGDIDPEGLIIADNLKKHYKDKIILFGYEDEIINNIHTGVRVKGKSIKKLKGIISEELLKAKQHLINNNDVIYQENYKEIIIDFIKK